MEVILHYRPSENTPGNAHKLCVGSLEEFPARRLPKFAPWFPHCIRSFTLKPQRCPPPVPSDFSSKADHSPFDPLHVETFLYFDSTPSLLEFNTNVYAEHNKETESYKDKDIHCPATVNENISDISAQFRTWSICTHKAKKKDTDLSPSEELKAVLEKRNLNIYYRGRWIVVPSVCGTRTLEDVWRKLSRLLRDKVLPSCNATIQRDINEIWIFCDLRYCEHIGALVKSELQLSGKMDLCVHKHGTIFSL
uniref:Shieldin complex subunit 3 n=1 Tax=Pyxicephalus adspersus TaxID=30357 RepID=A0AAV3A9N2_PYXAD|nr:TPA: hypothetical protein GDO54_014441 [Pyxicephalus adspersus]